MNIKLSTFAKSFSVLLGTLIITTANAIIDPVFMSVTDIEAGQKSTIRISGLTIQEKGKLVLERPTKNNISFDIQADEDGNSLFSIPSIHTETAGEYALKLNRELSGKIAADESFEVFPGKISAFKSNIVLSENSIPANGKTSANIRVTLKDAFNNAISNANLKAFSSRNEDKILLQSKTNELGIATGKIFSATPGVGTLSVLAEDILLFEKPEVVFHLDNSPLSNVGASGFGEFLQASLFNSDVESGGATEYFTLEGLNPEQSLNEDLTVRVSAKDANGNVDTNYTGTIRFSSTDSNAVLPADYTFKPTDQGVHTFYLAVSFGTVGQQTLSVLDTDDFRISGELGVNVLSLGNNTPPPTDTNASVRIDIPTNGAKFNSSRVTIGGGSNNCSAVKLVDGPTVLIEKLTVDDDGSYTYQTPALADGYHEFQAFCFPSSNVASNKVGITIDRTAPTVMSVELSPASCVQPGASVEVRVGSSEELSNANCIINNNPTSFEAIDAKTFTTTITAPNNFGQYPFQCSIFDTLGNELQEQNAGVLEVCEPREEEPEPEPENVAPSCVSNLNAKPGDGKVTLFWSPAKDDKSIKNYKVSYGNCDEPLTQINLTPDDRTQWYVDNLTSCQKYCFAVSPIDNEGLENEVCANEQIEEAPVCNEPVEIVPPESGGSSSMPLIISAIIGFLSFFFLARRKNS